MLLAFRPQLLVLMKVPEEDSDLDLRKNLNVCHLAGQLKAGKGLAIVVSFLQGDPCNAGDRQRAEELKERMRVSDHSALRFVLIEH